MLMVRLALLVLVVLVVWGYFVDAVVPPPPSIRCTTPLLHYWPNAWWALGWYKFYIMLVSVAIEWICMVTRQGVEQTGTDY